jgi:acyl-CoA thioesterase-1
LTLRAAQVRILALIVFLGGLNIARAASLQFEDRRCRVPPMLVSDDSPLPATAAAIRSGFPLTIVALGSSSTAGVGASSKQAAYPAVLEHELKLWLSSGVRVINRGVGGETIDRTAARIDRDVIPPKPTLVVWQTGTNDLLRARGAEYFAKILAAGIQRIRQHGIDVMLMDLQYFPRGERSPELNTYLQVIDRVGDRYDIPVLHRHRIMSYWLTSGELSVRQMLSRDQFHMSDEGYRCLGEIVADFILRRTNIPAAPANPTLHSASRLLPKTASGRWQMVSDTAPEPGARQDVGAASER